VGVVADAAAVVGAGGAERRAWLGQTHRGKLLQELIMSSLHSPSVAVSRARWIGLGAVLVAGAAALTHFTGCSSGPSRYQTPDAALDSLIAALRADNNDELKRVLGPGADDVLSSGDPVADANGRKEFLRLYDEKHHLETRDSETMILDVGATDWPLPIPLVKSDDGWSFDTAAGVDEMLSRRIGRNELSAIQVCLAIVDAEREYASADTNGDGWCEYAVKFKSDEGKKDGLYWPTGPGEPPSPMGDLVASATEEGYSTAGRDAAHPQPYHGYYYRILTSQGPDAPGGEINYVEQRHMIGGFAVVAWPAEYANSGLKTFITSHHGVVYQKDLGDDTDRLARQMKVFNPDSSWEVCPTEP
jgi:hypothetical protein